MAGRAAVAGLAGATAVAAPTALSAQDPGASSNEAAAPALDWRLVTLDGTPVLLRELLGRPVVLNVWATWCAPCVAELRSFDRLARSLPRGLVAFVMVAPQPREAVEEWVRVRGYQLPFYVEGEPMPEAFGLEALPTTWLLDSEGRVLLKRRGAVDWDREDVRMLLRDLAEAWRPR